MSAAARAEKYSGTAEKKKRARFFMCSIARRSLVYALAVPYVHATLVAMARNAGPYAAHSTARQLVRDHCEHWRDMLAASQFRAVELETTRLKLLVPDIEERLT